MEEELNGEGVELDLISAMKELDIQEKKTSDSETDSPQQLPLTNDSCKVRVDNSISLQIYTVLK